MKLFRFRSTNPRPFKPVILVTGASSGIGLALAHLLYKQTEYRVIITARQQSLSKLRFQFKENDRFILRPLDVTSESERQRLILEIHHKWQGVDILINNAGICYRSAVEHMSEQDEQHQLATNYLGPMALIRLVLPYMREIGRGKIINISSVSGMLAMPTMASYSASKHALEGASEGLWYECKPFGINISLVQPGFINSDSFKNTYSTKGADEAKKLKLPYHDLYKYMEPFIGKLMSFSKSTPIEISELILNVIQTQNPPLWIPATLDAKIFYYLRRLFPRRWLLPFLYACLPQSRLWELERSHRRDLRRTKDESEEKKAS